MNFSGRGAYTPSWGATNVIYFDKVEHIDSQNRIKQEDLTGTKTQLASTEDFFNSLRRQHGFLQRELAEYDIAENAINHYMKGTFIPSVMYPPKGIVPLKSWDGYDFQRDEYFDVKSHNAGIQKKNSPYNLSLRQWHQLRNDRVGIEKFFVDRNYVSELNGNFGIKVTPKQYWSAQIVKSSIFVIVYYNDDPNIYIVRYTEDNRPVGSRTSAAANARSIIVSSKRSRTS